MRESLKKALESALRSVGISYDGDIPLEHPAELKNGDYSSGIAMRYAKEAKVAPKTLAEKIVAALLTGQVGEIEGVAKIEVAGAGFINFYLTSEALADSLAKATTEDMWGANTTLSGKKIMVEYTDPNPFKEFHIGHLMSNAIGESISRLLQFSGAEVRRANYQGDVGPHVAKATWGKMQKPEVSWGEAYTYGSHEYEKHQEEIDSLNKKIYDNLSGQESDEEVNRLYVDGRKHSLEHFEELYTILGTKFDHYFFESETAPRGVALVKAHPDVFEKSDGAVVFKGEKVGLHTRVFITSKGLPTYETKELGLAELKKETWPPDISITVTAQEQADYFSVVVAAMKEFMPEVAKTISHITHGMMRFAEGKMSSRTGNVITGESLLAGLVEAAKERAADSRADDKGKLAQDVAVAAIKYQILRQASHKDIIFDRERALSLEGDSGPYLQYAHARASGIVEKAKEQGMSGKVDAKVEMNDLARLLHRFPEIVEYAASEREPHILTTYLLGIAGHFNSWYAQEHILDGTPAAAHKVALTAAVARTLKNGLWILGIPAPNKM